jgi:hypothetical protein
MENIEARDMGAGSVAGSGRVDAENIAERDVHQVNVNVGAGDAAPRVAQSPRPAAWRIAEQLVTKLDNGFTIEEILHFRDECETPEEREDVAFIAQMKNTKDITKMQRRLDRLEGRFEQRLNHLQWLLVVVLFGSPIMFVLAGLVVAAVIAGFVGGG